jgi:hypothetical protein
MKEVLHPSQLRACLAAILLACSTLIYAQGNELSVKLHLERTTVVDGKTVKVLTERAAPGEILQYVVTYENVTHMLGGNARPLSGVLATLPIPSEMVYTGSTQPKPTFASIDGKTFAAYPIVKPVKQTDGTIKNIQVDWAEYKALRWNLPEIAVKSRVDVSASVQLLVAQTVSATK